MLAVLCVVLLVPLEAEAAQKKKRKRGRKAKATTTQTSATDAELGNDSPPPPSARSGRSKQASSPSTEGRSRYSRGTVGGHGGVPYVQRPMLIGKGMLRVDVGPPDFALLSAGRGFIVARPYTAALGSTAPVAALGDDVGVYLGSGAAYGFTEEIEAGIVLLPLFMTPSFSYGDIDLYGRYLLHTTEKVQIALQANMWLPINSDFGLGVGAPLRWQLDERWRADTGLQLRFSFGGSTVVGVDAPFAVNYQASDKVFVGGRSGISWGSLSDAAYLSFPLGIQGGYHLQSGVADLTAWFLWPNFLAPAAPSAFNADVFQIGMGATFWFDLS